MTLGRDWRVLLVGGASGVGKTTLARDLARRFDVPLSHADDVRLALERATTPDMLPAVHRARATLEQPLDPEYLCVQWTDCARVISHALEIVLLHHVVTHAPIIFEGDTILPELVAARSIWPFVMAGHVRAVFLSAPSRAHLSRNAVRRGRGATSLSPDALQCHLHRNWLYNQWLTREARRIGVPVVIADSEGLADRVADAMLTPRGAGVP